MENKMQKIIALCKARGFLFQNAEIYGGLANTWDYGPMGTLLKNNIKSHWWKTFVQKEDSMFPLDTAILSLPKVWEASGHLKSFHDELVDCKSCKQRCRYDKLKEANNLNKEDSLKDQTTNILLCPNCNSNELTDVRNFHLMFRTYQGSIEKNANLVYLRPETAQGIFVQFKRVLESMRPKIPFGIAQIGKSFRNEITPSDFIFRMREFEQMEIEYFIHPKDQEKYFKLWIEKSKNWFLSLGVQEKNLRIREHKKDELAHYSNATVDIEYQFPFHWGELQGIACRGDFDLKQHQEYSSTSFIYKDADRKIEYIPYVIEPSFGLDRSILAFLLDAYDEELLQNGNTRNVLRLDKEIAPVKVAVFPLKRNNADMVAKAKKIVKQLQEFLNVQYDDRGSIGKLYRKQDEIGTPFCITVDFNAIIEENPKVTIRNRDTMKQEEIALENLTQYFYNYYIFRNVK